MQNNWAFKFLFSVRLKKENYSGCRLKAEKRVIENVYDVYKSIQETYLVSGIPKSF